MFGLKSFAVILAAATAFVSALPSPAASGAGLAKREANASPMAYALPHVERAAVPGAQPAPVLMVRTAPASVPDAINTCKATIAPIFVQIDAAIDAKASVSVFVTLWLQVVVAIKQLTVDITALLGASVDILAGLTISACATLFVDLILSICVKIQACVSVIAVIDLSVFVDVFVQVCLAIVACVTAIVKVVVGINVFLDVQLVACVNILLTLCTTLLVSVDVVAAIKGIILL